jgi:hypothetical protein
MYEFYEAPFEAEDIAILVRLVHCMALDLPMEERSLLVWLVMQRVGHPELFGNSITCVITAPGAFPCYDPGTVITCSDTVEMVIDTLILWWCNYSPAYHPVYAPGFPYLFYEWRDGRIHYSGCWR